jgi:predicted  nucleic acid-binding Zn-ribbon protein
LRKILPTLLSLSAAVLLFLAIDRVLERRRLAAEVSRLRGDLFQARAAAERCQGSLVNSEARLREFDDVIAGLRAQVDSFEALDPRGVPEDRYEEYMASFESYNDSVSAWEDRAQRLRTAEAACRATIEEHNALRDQLTAVLQDAGMAPAEPSG